MNILLEDGLPEAIDGAPIYPDFRNMVRFELLLQDDKVPEALKPGIGLRLLFETPPRDVLQGTRQLLWFYSGGRDTAAPQQAARPAPRAYDFEQDAPLIHAAFLSVYGIDLASVPFLHWWEFLSLLAALPDTTPMGMIMYYRTVDLAGITDPNARKSLEEKQRHWRLAPLFAPKTPGVRERGQSMKERVRLRTEQARQELAAARRGAAQPADFGQAAACPAAARREGGTLDHGL